MFSALIVMETNIRLKNVTNKIEEPTLTCLPLIVHFSVILMCIHIFLLLPDTFLFFFI